MKICSKCVLPETYPGIEFDENGVCSVCNGYKKKDNFLFKNEDDLSDFLGKFKKGKKYDVLVPISGGVDSSVALIDIVRKYKLKPLVFHNDHGYEDEIATRNVINLCDMLNADLVLWKHDRIFMKKLWKYLNEAKVNGISACYFCGNILYLNALNLAWRFDIPLVINGYSKGQANMVNDPEKGNELLDKLIDYLRKSGDKDFFNEFVEKYDLLSKQTLFNENLDLNGIEQENRILVIPFYLFKFNKTDKEKLKQICRECFNWQEMESTYPKRTTNCQMIWLNTYMDLKKMDYSAYTIEYSGLIRAGELTREQALDDLEYDPPEGLLEKLASDVGVDLNDERRIDFAEEKTGKREELAIEFDL